MEIIVCRGSSVTGQCLETDSKLSWGDDISDTLLATEEAGRERGRVEIDSSYTNRVITEASMVRMTFIQPGTLIGVENENAINLGLVTDFSLSFQVEDEEIDIESTIVVEQKDDV